MLQLAGIQNTTSLREWDVIEHMLAFLKPFEVATKRVSSSSYPIFYEAMPTYEWLMERLDVAKTKYANQSINPMLEPMRRKLQDYQTQAFKKPVYTCAALLDPCLKTAAFSQKTCNAMKMNPDHDSNHTDHSHDIDDNNEGPNLFLSKREVKTVRDEVNTYLSFPRELERRNPLEYWRTNDTEFPILARMAQCYLAVPATACPSEQAFSSGGRVMSDHRASMLISTLEALVCLKSWDRLLLFNDP